MAGPADDTTDSDDDLDITKVAKRDLGHDESLRESSSLRRNDPRHVIVEAESSGSPESDNDHDDGAVKPQLRGHPPRPEGERVDWSEDDDEAYDRFNKRKSAKRKRAIASTHKARAFEKKNGVVGKRQRELNLGFAGEDGTSNGRRETQQWGEESDDDQLMEYTLPDYLQKRRAKFDARYQKMKESGLKLPPQYDEVEFSDDEDLEDLAERPTFPRGKPVAPYKDKSLPKSLGIIPAAIAQWLRDYQVEGTAFLHTLFVYQTGGILGDDMGLGKTVQVIAFLTAAFGKTGDERDAKRMRKMRRANAPWYPRVLIVCPGTLIENWKDELKRWGWWHADVYHGEASAREAALQAAATGRVEILITTYATYRMNKGAINMVEWDCVVADECHQIKGRKSETTLAMNEINALCRIGLTGTAIQNSYDELWTLLNWTNPGKFGPISTWKTSISGPLRQGQSHDATHYQLSKARKTAKALVQNLLPQFFLRRMKTLIADQLPKKSDRVVFCPLTDTQADAYENIVDSDIIRYIRESTEICDCQSGKKKGWCCQAELPDGDKWQSYVFPAITHLQKLANHLAILIPQSTDPADKQSKDLETLQIAVPHQWEALYRTRDSILNYSNPEFCGKWKILKKLLRFWYGNGDKVLVFSHSVRLLKMLQMLFQHTSYNISYLDGGMSYHDRAAAVADFNSDPAQFVFLISTKAGGVGLNITSANKVVVVDPNWNPAYDLQAQDRAYRIGQVRDVEVFRLVSAGTIEEIVYARQIYKQQQANIGYTASNERRYFKGVQENKDQKGEIFGLANLFNYQHENLVLRDIVNKTNVAESKAGVAIAGIDLDSDPTNTDAGDHNNNDPSLADGTDPVGEEKALSQLAALIVDEAEAVAGAAPNKRRRNPSSAAAAASRAAKKSDPVQAILAGAGVEYSHENSEVVGSSKVEAGLSRRAQEAGADLTLGDRRIFAESQSLRPRRGRAQGDDDDNGDDDADDHADAVAEVDDDDANNLPPIGAGDSDRTADAVRWRYHPPLEVRKRQLCGMAWSFGFEEDVVGFAAVVEAWTQAGRREALEGYYRGRRRAVGLEERKGRRRDGVGGGGVDDLDRRGGNGAERDEVPGVDGDGDGDGDGEGRAIGNWEL